MKKRKAVVILGLAREELGDMTIQDLYTKGEVWTMNDFYQFYAALVPARVYNVHQPPWRHPSPMRYVGDWRAEYNLVAAGGTTIHTVVPIDGVQNQVALPTDELAQAFGEPAMSCQATIMVYHAILEGVEKITIHGVMLYDTEYQYQVQGLLTAMDTARERGIQVECSQEQRWRGTMPAVDWRGISTGMAPYWMRAVPVTVS